MRQSTIQTLNQLNQDFYRLTAADFDQTRSQPWSGWGHIDLLHTLPTRSIFHVLDIGCGNGRFAQYLADTYPQQAWEYVGVDSSAELLAKAPFQPTTTNSPEPASPSLHPHNIRTTYIQSDLLKLIHSDQPIVKNMQFDIVVCFGVLHHIPGAANRQLLLNWMSRQLSAEGKLWGSAWQFVTNPRLLNRAQSPTVIGLSTAELEEQDYILDWQRGPAAFRYAHYTSPAELADLINRSGVTMTHTYFADGSDNQQNHFVLATVAL